MKMIVAGIDCYDCLYYLPCENRAKVKCDARDKIYYIGQRIQCDDREIDKGAKNGRAD